MAVSAEDQIIHHLKDAVGLLRADQLVAALKSEQARADAKKLREIPLSGMEAGMRDVFANHIDPDADET
ncbi:hypothetical protein ABZX38_36205 [Streptomyces longwoodensis]|uniref:hypothetical protein n=1 Tax=Streptomyces longwoodensis TaxID=68231 RepID=UPI0033A97C8F